MAVLNRTVSLLKRVSTTPDVVFAGGVARNPCLKYFLGGALGCEVKVPKDPQTVGAYGAAIIARDQIEESQRAEMLPPTSKGKEKTNERDRL
jgi:activator of 2-hydroxyglutaryl-CoA dehydratase